MTLNQLLSLPKEINSLSIISTHLDLFFEQGILSDYYSLLVYYCEILYISKQYQEVIKISDAIIIEIGVKDYNEYFQEILYFGILSSGCVDKLDLTLYYINKRKYILQVKDRHKYLIDIINYKKRTKENYLEELLELYQISTNQDLTNYSLDELLSYYLNIKDYISAYEILEKLKSTDFYSKYHSREIIVLYYLNKLDDLIKNALNYLTTENDFEIIYYLVKSFIDINNYRLAEIYFVKYEELFESYQEELLVDFYDLGTIIYQSNNKKAYESVILKKEKVVKFLRKKTKESDIKKETNITVNITNPLKEKVSLSDEIELINQIFLKTDLINYELLRDSFIYFFRNIENNIKSLDLNCLKFSELIIYLDREQTNLYWYKQSRLYDKSFSIEKIDYSIIALCMEENKSFVGEPLSFLYKKNVLTGLPYTNDIVYLFCLPISNFGVLLVHYNEIQNFDLDYDLLTLLTSKISLFLENREKEQVKFHENNFKDNILTSPIFYMKYINNNMVKFNDYLKSLLQIENNELLSNYISNINQELRDDYINTINQLLISPISTKKTIIYKYQDKLLQEDMILLNNGYSNTIVSSIIDLSDYENSKISLENETNKYYIDRITNLENYSYVVKNYPKIRENKCTLCLISLDVNDKNSYDTNVYLEYYKEFVELTKRILNDSLLFSIDYFQLLTVINGNDIRTITKKIENYQKIINNYQSLTINRHGYSILIGIIRIPVVTTEPRFDRIMKYLDISVNLAKEKVEKYHFFEFSDMTFYKNRQTSLELLNICLENKRINLLFSQVYDLKEKYISSYIVNYSFQIKDTSDDYLKKIIEDEKMIYDFEFLMIEQTLSLMNEIFLEKKKYFIVNLMLSIETFKTPLIVNLFTSLYSKYKINYKFIYITLNDNFVDVINEIKIIDFLKSLGINFYTSNLDNLLKYNFYGYYYKIKTESTKENNYIKSLSNYLVENNYSLLLYGQESNKIFTLPDYLTNLRLVEGFYKNLTKDQLLKALKETNE